jgi:UDP-N-acetylglucosamine--N-acetylmuramyl-(pentapeptide) pyrophosphoryl-undecaprenol N-acetylglucosamine transferase
VSARPIVLAAGGTGGHVFPAEALAAELRRRGRALALVTDRRGGGYEERFPGIDIHLVPAASPSGRGSLGRLKAIGEIGAGVVAARALFRRLAPAAAVGFGGYPSLPAMLAASLMRLPTLIHEQNAHLGRANRLLAGRVGAIAMSFAETSGIRARDRAKVTLTGNPVREAIGAVREVPYAAPTTEGALRLLVLGGSQGATVLSEVVPAALAALPEGLRARLRVSQQCRAEDIERVRETYRAAGVAADLATFFHDVPAQLAACHLAITRAGASTVSELTVAGRPAILVPYPHATDDHQSANARAVVAGGGAWLMPQPKFTATALAETLAALAADPAALARMAAGARALGQPQAARQLADLVERLAPANGAGAERRAAA